jgi:trigger factor
VGERGTRREEYYPYMSVKIEQVETNTVKLTITVEPEVFEQSMHRAYLKIRHSVTIPGFRKGKAPRKIIEKFYGGEGVFYEEAFNLAFPEAYEKAVEETGIEPVDRPEIDVETIGSEKGLVFTAEVTVKPTVQLGCYKGIEVEKPEYNVTVEDVENEIQKARDSATRWVDVSDRPVQDADRVLIDCTGTIDGKAFEGGTATDQALHIGSGQFIKGFEEQIVGMNIDEERDIHVQFPDDYYEEELRGKDAVFHVKVNEITRKELPALDDEFVKDISEFDTLEEYRASIREKLEKQSAEMAESEIREKLLEKAVESSQVEVPDCMVESELDALERNREFRLSMSGIRLEDFLRMTGSDRKTMREEMKPNALRRVKAQLVMEAIIKAEGIEADEESVDAEIQEIAKRREKEFDEIKSGMDERDIEYIRSEVVWKKAIDLLKDNAVWVEPSKEATDSQTETEPTE